MVATTEKTVPAGLGARSVSICIPGDPVPQGRGRAVPTARGLRVTAPKRADAWKRTARACMAIHGPSRPLQGPVAVELLVVSRGSKSDRKKRLGRRWDARHMGDADNFAKAAMDAGNGLLYEDDRQVVDLHVWLVLAAHDEEPRVEMTVEPVGLGG